MLETSTVIQLIKHEPKLHEFRSKSPFGCVCDTITRWWDFIKRSTENRKYGRNSASLKLPQQLMTLQQTWSGTATLLIKSFNCYKLCDSYCDVLRSSGLNHKQGSLTKHSCVVPKRSSIRVVMKISCCKMSLSWKSGKVVACSVAKLLVLLKYFWLLEKKTLPSYKSKNTHLIERKLKFYSRGSNVFYATSD